LLFNHEEKLNLMLSLNWDYLDTHEDMLAVIEGRIENSGAFTRDKLFVRSLERLPWHYVTALWGIEKSKRYHFDFALAVLRREPLPLTRWGDERFEQMKLQMSERFFKFQEFEAGNFINKN
jgi:hypothetical protein